MIELGSVHHLGANACAQ